MGRGHCKPSQVVDIDLGSIEGKLGAKTPKVEFVIKTKIGAKMVWRNTQMAEESDITKIK